MVNSFDKWMQSKIWADYIKVMWDIRYNSFDNMAKGWRRNNTKTTLVTDLAKSWHISEKKARLYARYIIGYLEDKQGVAKQSYLTADDAGELMSLIGEYVSSQCRSTGKLCAFIDKLRKVAS